jgi:hypothetical protein
MVRSCEQILAEAVAPHPYTALVSEPDLTWARAADLVVGVVSTRLETLNSAIDRSYEALEAAPVTLRRDDLWSIVLLVQLPAGTSERVRRNIEVQTTGSRKLAFNEDMPVPKLFVLLGAQRSSEIAGPLQPTSTVEDTLTRFAAGNKRLRVAFDVLLKARQPRDEVEELIRILAEEQQHGSK